MAAEVGMAAETASAVDTSLLGMFLGADFVVQLVMIGLLAASVYSWSVIFSKVSRLSKLRRAAKKFEEAFWSGGSLDVLHEKISRKNEDPMARTFAKGMEEWGQIKGKATGGLSAAERQNYKERLNQAMTLSLRRSLSEEEGNVGSLATISSAAPFVGLFGTVWGIMNSFQGIAASQSTNLAVVAPGIAEALFATALGLVAAIPALVAYNKISQEIDAYGEQLETFKDEFISLVNKKLEG